jgi:hypothetical protein
MPQPRFSKAAQLELLIYAIVAVLMVACSWLLMAYTGLPTWLAIVLGCIAAVVLALLANLAWAMVRLFRGPPDE